MKNVTSLMLATTLTLSSFTTDRTNDNLRPAEVTARGLVTALRQQSEAKFIALFPTIAEFQRQMDANASFYGSNLEAAKADFAKTYATELLPAVRRAYATLTEEAERREINWSDVTVESVAITDLNVINITFEQNGSKFHLLIERSLMIEGKWKVSQYVKFI